MANRFTFFVLTVAVLSLLSCNAQHNKIETGLDSFINKKGDSLFKSQKIPGMFIGISDNGIRKYYSFGYANPDKKMPFDSATIFEIGSLTKTFTAYVLEMALKEKSISDSSSIINYLPDSVQKNKALQKITFLNLMNHTSGLPRLPDNIALESMQPYENYDEKLLFAFLKDCQPKMPGQYEYSNLAFGLAGVLSTIISKKPYSSLVNEYIFYPMQIRRSGENLVGVKESQGFFDNTPVDFWKFDAFSGAGSLICSANEMLTYFKHISSPDNERTKQVIDKLLEPTSLVRPGVNICRAWHTIEEGNKPVIYWHNGGTYGFSTFGAFIKEKDKAVIIVINQFNKNNICDEFGISIIKKMTQ